MEYSTDGQAVKIVYSGATNGWIPITDQDVTDVPVLGNQNGIFSFGYISGPVGMSNLVSNAGVVATDVSAVGTARGALAACSFG